MLAAVLFVAALAGSANADSEADHTTAAVYILTALICLLAARGLTTRIEGTFREELHEFDIPGFPDDRSEKPSALGGLAVPLRAEDDPYLQGTASPPPGRPHPTGNHRCIFDGREVRCRKPGCDFAVVTHDKGLAEATMAAHTAYPRNSIDEAMRMHEEDVADGFAEPPLERDRRTPVEMPMGPIEDTRDDPYPPGSRVFCPRYAALGTVMPGGNPGLRHVKIDLGGSIYALPLEELEEPVNDPRGGLGPQGAQERGREFHRQAREMNGTPTVGDLVSALTERIEAEEHSMADARLVLTELGRWVEDKWGPEARRWVEETQSMEGGPVPKEVIDAADEDEKVVHIDLGRMMIVGPAPFDRPGVIDLPATGALSGYIGVHGKPVLESQVHGNHLAEAIRQDQFQRAVLSQEATTALATAVGEREALLRQAQPHILERRDAAMEAVDIEDDDNVRHVDALVELANEIAEVLGTAAEDKYERASEFPPDGPDDAEGEAPPPTDPEDTEEEA